MHSSQPAAHFSDTHIYITAVIFLVMLLDRVVISPQFLISGPENHTHIAATLGTPQPNEIIKGSLPLSLLHNPSPTHTCCDPVVHTAAAVRW